MQATAEDRTEFHAERLRGLGGSDAAAILGLSKFNTALDVWMQKTGRKDPTEDNPILRRGRLLEPVVRAEYELETGLTVQPGKFLVHRSIPWMIGHTDGHPMDGERGPGVFEGKSANVYKIREWDEEAPLAAQVQLQHYIEVADLPWGSVAGLLGGLEFKYQNFDRNLDFIGGLIEREAAFWKLVENDTPPEPVAADAATLSRLWETIEGKSIDLPEEAIAIDRQWVKAKADIKLLEELRDEAIAKLKFMMGDAEIGRLPGLPSCVTFKTRKGYSEKAIRVVAPTRVLGRSAR